MGTFRNSRILRKKNTNLKLSLCIDVPVLLHSIWELLSNTLFTCTFDFMYFFQFLPGFFFFFFFYFLPEETKPLFSVSSILPGRNPLRTTHSSVLKVRSYQAQVQVNKNIKKKKKKKKKVRSYLRSSSLLRVLLLSNKCNKVLTSLYTIRESTIACSSPS